MKSRPLCYRIVAVGRILLLGPWFWAKGPAGKILYYKRKEKITDYKRKEKITDESVNST